MGYHWDMTEFGKTKVSEKTFAEHMSRYSDHPDCAFVLQGMGIGHFYKDGENIYFNEQYCRAPDDKIVATRSLVRRLEDLNNLIDALEQSYLKGESVVLVYPEYKVTIDLTAIPEIRTMIADKILSERCIMYDPGHNQCGIYSKACSSEEMKTKVCYKPEELKDRLLHRKGLEQ